ncbi:hypothetical protein [Nonomuraea sediminis]|uniref:hypothetical protein n=1 Tax=Nonomuraea sediminis TaxID=2835864 RepID=UPI001BDCD9DF|nr:hypothetical protein [Nonomuraea sediminis]
MTEIFSTLPDQSFDWTRDLDPDVRADVTTWLEIGDRAFLYVDAVTPGPRSAGVRVDQALAEHGLPERVR